MVLITQRQQHDLHALSGPPFRSLSGERSARPTQRLGDVVRGTKEHRSPSSSSESDRSAVSDSSSPAASIASSATSISSSASDNDVSTSDSNQYGWQTTHHTASRVTEAEIAPDTRQSTQVSSKPNPRRTSASASWRRPNLVREGARRLILVEQLVDSATALVNHIWPMSDSLTTLNNRLISLRFFIRETLRRSRTSYSTLQVTLWYLVLIRPFVLSTRKSQAQEHEAEGAPTSVQTAGETSSCALLCGRRMFLSALILASKYLQDRNFTTKAWSKITGLPAKDIVQHETLFLQKIDWKLHISERDFRCWNSIILSCTDSVRIGRHHTEAWTQVLGKVLEGVALGTIAKELEIRHQLHLSAAASGQQIGLLTPSPSFGSEADMSKLNAEQWSPPSLRSDSSPALSSGGESSASDLSCREIEASAPHSSFEHGGPSYPAYENPMTDLQHMHPSMAHRRTLPVRSQQTYLPTPTPSMCSERSDEDGPFKHPSQAQSFTAGQYTPPRSPDQPAALNSVDDLIGNCPLVDGMEAPANLPRSQQTDCMPPSGGRHSDMTALTVQSIAHRNMSTPAALCGSKRSSECAGLGDSTSKMQCTRPTHLSSRAMPAEHVSFATQYTTPTQQPTHH